MRIIDTIGKNLVETTVESLPPEVVDVTKKQILDTLAAAVGGTTCSIAGEINKLVELVKDWGGKEESSLIGFGGRVPAPNAAFVNGILCVRLDFDDTQVRGLKIHLSRAIVPPAFAMAERQGNIGGKEFLTAVALGHDLAFRLRQAVGQDVNASFGMVTNFFGAAASAGKILGLSKEQFGTALGLAFHQISGAQSGPGTAGAGASIKGLNNGIAAKAGVTSALLAERGFTANSDFLETSNKKNMYGLFFQGLYSPELLVSGLGKIFTGPHTSQKEFPCCHGQHTAIEAALDLVKRHGVRPDQVAEVLLHISPGDYDYLASPVEKKQNPQNIIETQFSLYWGVASAIVYGEANIRNFTSKALQDMRIWEMVRKISARPEKDLVIGEGFTPAILELKTKEGEVYTERVDSPFGSPENPMSYENVAEKFRHCCEYSIRPIPTKAQEQVIRLIGEIEEVKDVSEIVRLLS